MRIRLPLLAALACLPAHAAEPTPPTLAQALQATRASLTLEHGHLAGPAAPTLTTAIAQARYVAIGEDHLTAEIPAFTAAICDATAPTALVTETAPQVSALVTPLLGQQNIKPALTAITRKYPNAIAFMDMANEADLVTHCARAAGPKKFHFFGLDQEFVGSAGWLLDLIAARPLPPKTKAAITALRAEEQRDAADALKSGDPSKLFLFAVPQAELAATQTLLRTAHDAKALDLFEELIQSHDIYTDPSGSHSNRVRGLLLKHHLAQDLQTLPPGPSKILLKFGDTHMHRGFNELHQPDLGNFVSELADGQGATSLHIMILGARGTHRLFTGYAHPTALQPFVMTEDPAYAWLKPAIANLAPSGWTLFDLRSLRFRKLSGLDADWSRVIYGYDLLVIIPELTPADPL
jgi:hypothetical protein